MINKCQSPPEISPVEQSKKFNWVVSGATWSLRVGDNLIERTITRRGADELNLKKGDTVFAVVKATEVMIQKD